MRPSVLVICRQLFVEVLGVGVCGIEAECGLQWLDFREIHHQLCSGSLYVGAIVLLVRFCEGPVCHLHFHRGPILLLRAAHIHHSSLCVDLDLRIVRHHKALRALQDVV